MNRFQRWALLLVSYFLLWPTVVVLKDFTALADGGGWVFMTIMWATMAVALLPLLPFTIDAPAGRGRRLRFSCSEAVPSPVAGNSASRVCMARLESVPGTSKEPSEKRIPVRVRTAAAASAMIHAVSVSARRAGATC
jgi:hypothetical protein